MTRARSAAPAPDGTDALARLTGWMAGHPVAAVVALVAAQTWLGLAHGELWYIDEVRHASVLRSLLAEGHWLVLHLDGQPYPDKPPVYFWLLAGLARLLGTDGPIVHAVAVALSAILFALATWWLARAVGGLDREGALLAALVLVSTIFFVERSHAPRMDLLFAALITVASGCLFLAWRRPAPAGAAIAGLALAGVATLVKGPLGLAFPALSSVAFLALRRRLGRLARWDVAVGAIAAAAIVGAWLGACYLVAGGGFLRLILGDQIIRRTVASPLQHEGFSYYWRILPFVVLPWTVVWLVAAVSRMRRWRAGDGADGTLFLACMVLAHLAILTAMSYKLALYLLHVLAPLAVLTARLMLGFDLRERRASQRALGLAVVAGGLALPWLPRLYPWPEALRGLGGSAALFVLAGVALLLLGRDRPAVQVAAATAVGVTIAVQPLVLITRPSLDAVMSPRALGELIRGYARDGYTPVTFQARDYREGTLSYYAGQTVPDVGSARRLRELLDGPRPVVVVTLEARWAHGPGVLRRLTPVHRQRLDRDRWVVLVGGGPR
jgi:4-amino-4-deoxy-L-arabinose transferase-like glycosyltransferase